MKNILNNRPQVKMAYQWLHTQIIDMAVGVPLPPVATIMQQLAVSRATLDSAYRMLEAEGLIERHPGKGVFVSDRCATGEIAIVIKSTLLSAESSAFFRLAVTSLTKAISELNPRWQVKLHVGQDTETDEAFPATLDLTSPVLLPSLRGVFSFCPLFGLGTELEERGVPLVRLGASNNRCSVSYDRNDFLERSIQHLAGRGCCSVGLIYAVNRRRTQRANSIIETERLVAELAGRAGLQYHHEWLMVHDGDWSETTGYELLQNFWQLNNRPDAVVVTDDILCNGALRALLQLGVSLPDDLSLVTLANQGGALAYHEPVTRVEFDVDQMAKQAVVMMDDLLHGRSLVESNCLLKGKLIQGKST
ncbi:MAG: GntR family transcriptional regulator [Victivallaceae bacterium]|nr:GntR family transcriptional regulator [Victivallaceae bacterium]